MIAVFEQLGPISDEWTKWRAKIKIVNISYQIMTDLRYRDLRGSCGPRQHHNSTCSAASYIKGIEQHITLTDDSIFLQYPITTSQWLQSYYYFKNCYPKPRRGWTDSGGDRSQWPRRPTSGTNSKTAGGSVGDETNTLQFQKSMVKSVQDFGGWANHSAKVKLRHTRYGRIIRCPGCLQEREI